MSFDFGVLVRDGLEVNSVSDDAEDEALAQMDDVANGRAMEIYMDGGFFAPLEKLSNVRFFEFQFTGINEDGADYEPKPRHERIMADLKQKIKDNYACRHQ